MGLHLKFYCKTVKFGFMCNSSTQNLWNLFHCVMPCWCLFFWVFFALGFQTLCLFQLKISLPVYVRWNILIICLLFYFFIDQLTDNIVYCVTLKLLCFQLLFIDQLTDDITWTNEGLDNLQEQCLVIIEVDVTLWVTIEGGAVAPPPEITGAICPNNCHDNGTCAEGEAMLVICTAVKTGYLQLGRIE